MMKSTIILVFLALVACSNAELTCIEGNCVEPNLIPAKLDFLNPLLPEDQFQESDAEVFNVEDNTFNKQEDNQVNDKSEAQDLITGDQPQGMFILRIKQTILLPKDDDQESLDSFAKPFPELNIGAMFHKMFEELGILDLSGRNMTGDQLARELSGHDVPVTSLILSNSRISDLTPNSFSPVENSLKILQMDNCSVSLQALSQLTNLRVLNLSNNALSTFEWFSQMTDTLEVLDLSNNLFKEVRPELSVLTSLKELYLSHNQITSVSKNPISMLSSMEKLSLSMNELNDADLSDLDDLQEADLDWNYLRLFGKDLVLPAHRLSVRLASNPWRCDCGMIEARDSYDVEDLQSLRCANQVSYAVCKDCKRYFLPLEDGKVVSNLTVDSIEHLGCTGLSDQFYLFVQGIRVLEEREPEKLVQYVVLVVLWILLMVSAIMLGRRLCRRKKFDHRAWLSQQQIPYLKIDKIGKPQEVPYVKMGSDMKV